MSVPTCRGCGADDLRSIVSLGQQPLANAFTVQPNPPGEHRYPLDMALCEDCALAQLTVTVPPAELFSDYAYFSSYSPTLGANAAELAGRLVEQRSLGPGDLAMEIGSNDGYLLQHYQERGVPVLGVDPACNVVEAARARGVPTECEAFGIDTAGKLAAQGHRATVLHANNVLAHVPDVNGVLAGSRRILADDGVMVVETPYVRDLVEHLEFDTIYHEHLFYYSVIALDRLFRRNGLRLDGIEHLPVHGGSLRVFGVVDDGANPPAKVQRFLDEERRLGIDRLAYFQDFGQRVDELRSELSDLLDNLRARGARLAGYGAAAKATVLLNAIGAEADTLEFVADQSPHKQGRHIPGVGTPIVEPATLLSEQPDYVLLLAWNFASDILEQQGAYRRAGGRFIMPVPEPRVIGPDVEKMDRSSPNSLA